ncbi:TRANSMEMBRANE PROTEIN [Salix purpurea]|uniref:TRANSMEMBRANE PROTEIN n=1 Tax=Salix purpurea TaxID=77065 RepID=A0A9Q0V3Y7_SALPP|nr:TRANSMEMBRANE PROTEIN [Salix purpurea]
MFEHGDDLTIEGHRILWLIWIQILVFLLLLLFCFSFFPADLPDTTTTTATTSSSASPSTPGVFMPLNFHLENQILEQNDRVSNRLQHSQVLLLHGVCLPFSQIDTAGPARFCKK